MSRIPLVATVVGALLVGGAVTGGTYASWSNQRQLQANGVQSGAMSFTATSPGAVSVNKVNGSTADATVVLDDTSVGKNLQQRITASVAGTPAGITARIGTACGATTTSVAVDTTPTSANQNLCVRVTSSTTAVSGDVTVNVSGAQRPTGWSTPTTTRIVPVTVIDPTPVISCQSGWSNTFTWPASTGTYRIYTRPNNNAEWHLHTTTSTNTFTWSGIQSRQFQVTAVSGGVESAPSNAVRISWWVLAYACEEL